MIARHASQVYLVSINTDVLDTVKYGFYQLSGRVIHIQPQAFGQRDIKIDIDRIGEGIGEGLQIIVVPWFFFD